MTTPEEPRNPWAAPQGPVRRPPEPRDDMYGPIDPDPFGAGSSYSNTRGIKMLVWTNP